MKNNYGVDVLKFEILEFDCKQLILREQYYIDTLKPFFNICKIAGSRSGTTQSTITKNKISLSLIGKKHTIERRKNMSIGKIGYVPWITGKHHSEDTKNKISRANKGKMSPMKNKKHSYLAKEKISQIQKKKTINLTTGMTFN